ncbi:MAG: flagellar motor switch protein FliN [Gammaproteobacteria bacterium]|nr:flagellar motor switch protein FliN [Gammaproteobacteria bacterium]
MNDETDNNEADSQAADSEATDGGGADASQDGAADDWAAALSEQDDAEKAAASDESVGGDPYETAEFQDLQPETGGEAFGGNIDIILDIPVTISMEIGRTLINIRNLLQLNQGSVIELDRLAGEPMDVMVNGTLVAHGEVVVVNEKFGIRLTDVISPAERVKKLK